MKPSKSFDNLIVLFEGLKTHAYKDSAGIATIGIGTIRYPNGEKVKMGDIITEAQAYEYLEHEVDKFVVGINKLLSGVDINQHQFDAILCFVYNLGLSAFANSDLFKLIKKNPADANIKEEWMRWNKSKVNGVLTAVKGLTNRRAKEYQLYSTSLT